jgi:hypothetical protein
MRSTNGAPSPATPAASTESTTISLIEAMMPTTRNGSATSSRFSTVVRSAKSSSTTMKTSRRTSRPSSSGVAVKSSSRPHVVFAAIASRRTAERTRNTAMPP